MKLPELIHGNHKTRREEVAFGGVNYSEAFSPGEWEETENLGSGRFPALSPRAGRGVARTCSGAPTALYAWEELASVEGTGFYYGGAYIGEVSAGPKQMVRVGDQIVIWPDKKYYNWKTGEFPALAVGFTIYPEVSSVIAERYIALPQETWAFQDTPGSQAEVYAGPYLSVPKNERAGTRYWMYSYGVMVQKSIDELREGSFFYEKEDDSTAIGRITKVTVVEREYLPGILRNWAEVQYDGVNGHASGKLTGWAYTTNRTILNMAYDPGFGNYVYRLRKHSSWEGGLMGYQRDYSPNLGGQGSGTRVQNGDILFYDPETGTGKMVAALEQQEFYDHYYTAHFELRPVTLVKVRKNEDPETICQSLAIENGDRVRVSRGNVSIDTVVNGFADSKDVDGLIGMPELPGMSDAVLSIRFTDSITALWTESGPVSIDRITDPDLDFICVHDNRLWGVHDNRIYCSKFGNPQDFQTGTGNDADAWWTEVGSPGEWTGIVSYSGTVLAFKENLVHKVVGDLPSEFTVSTYHIAGIQPGSHQSVAIVNEVLYYKGSNGVYAYSGYTPSFISANFGERKFHDAVGGTDGTRFYLSMQDEAGAWQLYCYDTIRGVWLREDSLHAAAFSLHNGTLYCAAAEAGTILTFGEDAEPGVRWSAVSVPFYEGSFDRKQVTKLLVRAELPAGSVIRVAISYDGGVWQELYNTRAPRWRVAILPVRPKRCDSFRLRISGEGDVTLRGIAREVLTGSEV